MTGKEDRHVISAEVENRPGVLARVVSLFSARGFNIESLNVGETNDPRRSRITIAVAGEAHILEQIRKQLEKLIDTHKVTELSGAACVERDLALVKIKVPAARRGEMRDLADIFRAKIADVTERHMTVEISGSEDKIQAFLRLAAPFGVTEMARSGRIAIKRGD